MPEAFRYAGIDVAQGWLDVAIHGMGQPWRVTADEAGMESLMGTLREHGVHLVVQTATAGYGRRAGSARWFRPGPGSGIERIAGLPPRTG